MGTLSVTCAPLACACVKCSGQRDAGAGDLCAGIVRMRERRINGDCGAAESPDGRDDCILSIRTSVDGDGLAVAKTNRAGDRDNSCAHVGGDAHGGGAGRADRSNDGGLELSRPYQS